MSKYIIGTQLQALLSFCVQIQKIAKYSNAETSKSIGLDTLTVRAPGWCIHLRAPGWCIHVRAPGWCIHKDPLDDIYRKI